VTTGHSASLAGKTRQYNLRLRRYGHRLTKRCDQVSGFLAHEAIVLDNVLFINSVEAALKNLMSRMEVRITTDQEVAGL